MTKVTIEIDENDIVIQRQKRISFENVEQEILLIQLADKVGSKADGIIVSASYSNPRSVSNAIEALIFRGDKRRERSQSQSQNPGPSSSNASDG